MNHIQIIHKSYRNSTRTLQQNLAQILHKILHKSNTNPTQFFHKSTNSNKSQFKIQHKSYTNPIQTLTQNLHRQQKPNEKHAKTLKNQIKSQKLRMIPTQILIKIINKSYTNSDNNIIILKTKSYTRKMDSYTNLTQILHKILHKFNA